MSLQAVMIMPPSMIFAMEMSLITTFEAASILVFFYQVAKDSGV